MSHRFAIRAVSLATLFALAACNDRPAPSAPADVSLVPTELRSLTTTCNVTRIFQLVAMLSPTTISDPPFDMRAGTTTILILTNNQLALAQKLALGLAKALGNDLILAKLRDPNGSAPPTKGEAISELINLVFQCVNLPQPGDIAGAYGSGGQVAIVGPSGGDVVAKDKAAALRIPPGAFSEDRLIAISPMPALALAHSCLPPGVGLREVDECYEISATPDTPFNLPVRAVLCSFAFDTPGGPPNEEIHNHLRIAKTSHTDPTKADVFDRKSDPFALDCSNQGIHTVAVSNPVVNQLVRFASLITKPFRPSVAFAIDGVGADILGLSHATTVYATEFEDRTEAAQFTTTGFWNRNAMTGLFNTAYTVNQLVDRGAGDNSGGALPSPFAGSNAMWYGQAENGNYVGTLASTSLGGGESVSANQGELVSPAFYVPNVTNAISFTLASWFEIEGVNPASFDLMDVVIEDVGTIPTGVSLLSTSVRIDRLNPSADPTSPGARARLPYTSGGFNVAPVWQPKSYDLSAYRGRTIRLHFTFNTVDTHYNGFRGWIVDEVVVRVAGEDEHPHALTMVPLRASMEAQPVPVRDWAP